MPAVHVELESIRTREELEAFVASHPESGSLEYKTLADVYRCAECAYCRNPRSQSGPAEETQPRPGVPLARAAASLANTQGGAIIVGVRIVEGESGRHALQDQKCETHTYSQEELTQQLLRLTSPPVEPQIQTVTSPGAPPAFVLKVRESLVLHGWKPEPGAYLRFSSRFGATTSPMSGSEIEFVTKNKATYRENTELRRNVLYAVVSLWHRIFDWPETRPAGRPWYASYPGIVSKNPYGCAQLQPGLPTWDAFPEVEQLIHDMPSKIAVLHAPHDVALAIRELEELETGIPHSILDPIEGRFLAVVRSLARQERVVEGLDPLARIAPNLGADLERAHAYFIQGSADRAYALSFGAALGSYKSSTGSSLGPDATRQATRGLAHALSGLLPTSIRLLALYLDLRDRFGAGSLGLDEPGDALLRGL
jgi:hypothetical protein